MTTETSVQLADTLRGFHRTGRSTSAQWRMDQLDSMARMLTQNVSLWEEALRADLGKSELESHMTEIGVLLSELRHTRRRLRWWMLPKPVVPSLATLPAYASVRPEPYGAVLVIAPWNYPLQLALSPVIGALAAGNAVAIKPSEYAPATSALLAELVPAYLDDDLVRVVEGGVDETTELLDQRWDFIFYTGNSQVGRIIATAAAKHLTPVALELGGKSPVYVDRSADLRVTARRLVWAKTMNAGQTCVAPDYVLVDRTIEAELVEAIREALREQRPDALSSDDYGSIVNARHFDRLLGLLDAQRVAVGGGRDESAHKIEPTVLVDVSPSSDVMQEEIFGPILPVLPVSGVDEAIAFVNDRDKPLALYVFASDASVARRFERETSSGALGVNIALAHLSVPGLPFGGVGESGMGAYHGRRSFNTFSHEKAVLRKGTLIDTVQLVYPPFTPERAALVRKLLG